MELAHASACKACETPKYRTTEISRARQSQVLDRSEQASWYFVLLALAQAGRIMHV